MSSFFRELKRRNVYKVAAAYIVVAWLLIQVTTQTFPFFEIPNWAIRLVILLLVLGLPVALIIAWAFELTPEGIKRTEDSAGDLTPTRNRGRGWIVVAACAGLLSLALFFLGRYTAGPTAATDPTVAKSVAVLPFDNFNKDPENAYFADGIQDEILTRLAKIDDLKVISRTSTQRYKSSPENLPEIARQLGVAHVLEGSVQKAGDQVRVTVQLIRAATDSHVWAETYDRKLTDIFAVQSDVAENIAKALRAKLTPQEQKAVAARPTENAEAYDAYLRGLAIWNSLDLSPAATEQMANYYGRAVQLDPRFALAWAHLSVTHTLAYAEFDPTPDRRTRAQQALQTAKRLQPDLGEGYFALGLYRYRALYDYEGALQAFSEAIERGVNKAMSLEFSGYVKRRQGKWEETLALHEAAAGLDPRNQVMFSERAVTLRGLRRFAEARAALDRALEISPGNPHLLAQKAIVYHGEGNFAAAEELIRQLPTAGDLQPQMFGVRFVQWMCTRRFDEAIREAEALLAAPERLAKNEATSFRARLGAAKRWRGDADRGVPDLTRARAEFEALREQSDKGEGFLNEIILTAAVLGDAAPLKEFAPKLQARIDTDAFYGVGLEEALAAAHAQLGHNDEAIAILERLLQKPGDVCVTTALLRADPMWDPLRGDPRFQRLLEAKP